MRSSTVAILSFVLMTLLLGNLGAANVEGSDRWPVKRGELCWRKSGGDILKLFVTNMGRKHYLVNGVHIESSGDFSLVNGNAEIIGDRIIMHYTSSSFDTDEVWGFLGNADLDKATLNGILDGLAYFHDKAAGEGGFEYDGNWTLTNISCPRR